MASSPAFDDDPERGPRQWRADKAAWIESLPPALGERVETLLDDNAPDAIQVGSRLIAVDEWLAVLREQLHLFDMQSRMRLAPEHVAVGHVVGAWRAVFFRQLRATLTLIDNGLSNEAQANARAALEHAALLATLEKHRTTGTVETFMQDVVLEVHRQAEGQLKVLRRIAAEAPPADRALLAAVEEVAGGRQARGQEWDGTQLALFRALPGGESTYSLFRQCSNNVHAGGGSATPFFQGILERGSLQREPQAHLLAELLSTLVACAAIVDRAMDGFLTEPQLQAPHAPLLASVNLKI